MTDAKDPKPSFEIPSPAPWPSPVDGPTLLDEACKSIRKYVVLSDPQVAAVALWALFTHAFDAFHVAPLLIVTSPVRESGKGLLFDVLSHLVKKPLWSSNTSPSSLFRLVEAQAPTLLLDEMDSFPSEGLRNLLNAAHRKSGARVLRVEGDRVRQVKEFRVWTPIATAGIGELHDTVQSRGVVITMRRRLPSEKVEQFRHGKVSDLALIGEKMARWALDNVTTLAAHDPTIPSSITNRRADVWAALLAIADVVGGSWPAYARQVALYFETTRRGTVDSGEILLGDLRDLFDRHKATSLPTKVILDELNDMDNRSWGTWGVKGLGPQNLSKLLEPFGIGPDRWRIGKQEVRGYHRTSFTEAWARYLPST